MGASTEVTKDEFLAQLQALDQARQFMELLAFADAHADQIASECTREDFDEIEALMNRAAMLAS